MDEQKYKQYLNSLEIEENATLAEIKTAFERLKKIYSSDSIVMEAIEDEFPEEDKKRILTDIQEAYSGLFHYLVEKDRIEKENFEKEKTAKEIFDIDDFEGIDEEFHESDTPLLIEEEIEEIEEIVEVNTIAEVDEIVEADEIAEVDEIDKEKVERSDTWLPPNIPEPPEPPEQVELPDFEEPEKLEESLSLPEPVKIPEPSKTLDFQDTQELFVKDDPLEIPEYIFPEQIKREKSALELEKSRSPYSTMIRISDPSATNPLEELPLDPDMEEYETEGGAIIKGRTFKKYREQIGMGIHELAKTSKISYKILVNIELERFENLPEPGYLRWCVSTYAKELGMDSPTIADEYMKRYRQWKRQQEQK